MPVVTVRALSHPDFDVRGAAERVGAAVSRAGGLAPNQIWVVWQPIPSGHYVIAGAAPDMQPQDSHPALVEISSDPDRSDETIETLMESAAAAVAAELGVPHTNVRVFFAAAAPRRLYTKGRFR